MAEKVVDVVLRDRLVASYPVVLNRLNAAISEQDFIGLARDSMRENGYTAEVSRNSTAEGAEFSDAIEGTLWPTWCGAGEG